MNSPLCPCCSGKSYQACCQSLHNGGIAESPEQLMRSRYSAFAIGDSDYLLRTSSTSLQTNLSKEELDHTCQVYRFVSLEVISANDNTVEFVANLLHGDELHPLHETSSFIQQENEWKYDSGILHETHTVKLKRNDKCPCGSGKKYKQCHMNK